MLHTLPFMFWFYKTGKLKAFPITEIRFTLKRTIYFFSRAVFPGMHGITCAGPFISRKFFPFLSLSLSFLPKYNIILALTKFPSPERPMLEKYHRSLYMLFHYRNI